MKFILPTVSVILFLLCVYRLTCRFFQPSDEMKTAQEQLDWKAISAFMVLVSVVWTASLFLYAMSKNPGSSLDEALRDVFIQLDVNSYVNLAKYGYGTGEAFHEQELMIVFFPLWWMLLKAVQVFLPIGWYVLGTILQIPLFAAGMTMFYIVASKEYNQRTAKLALLLLLASPGAFFFLAPMTESLFLALCMLAFWAIQNQRFWIFAAAGYAAAFTRSPGVLLIVPALVMAFTERKKRHDIRRWGSWVLAASGPALGIGTYLFINFKIYGDWFAYSEFQWTHWGQKLGLFCNTIMYHQKYFLSKLHQNTEFAIWVSLLAILVILVQFVAIGMGSKNMPVHWGFYSLCYLLLVDGATWLLSAPRYALCLPFVHLAIANQLRKPIHQALVLIPLSMVSILYFAAFLQRAPIY